MPTYKYDSITCPAVAKALCKRGATDRDLALEFGVTVGTICNWRVKHPEFKSACAAGKEVIDEMVENALLRRATGWTAPETRAFYDKDLGEVITHEIEKHYPADLGAAKFWLLNRQPDKWREHSEQMNATLTVEVVRRQAALPNRPHEVLDGGDLVVERRAFETPPL